MNKDAQEIFDEIIKANPQDLNFEQRQFLNARRDYLNDEQKRIFADILNQVKTDDTNDTSDTETDTPKEEIKETPPEDKPEDKLEDVFGDK